jgi:hypothetical protein
VENLAPTGIWSPHRPARSQSLYRLSCRAHRLYLWPALNDRSAVIFKLVLLRGTLKSAVHSLRERQILDLKTVLTTFRRWKLFMLLIFPFLEALHNREHMHASTSLACIRSNLALLLRHSNGTGKQQRHCYSVTHTVTSYKTRSLLLCHLHYHSLSLTERITCSLSITVTISLSESFELSLTFIISMNHWLPLSYCHSLQQITDTISLTVIISFNHWLPIIH